MSLISGQLKVYKEFISAFCHTHLLFIIPVFSIWGIVLKRRTYRGHISFIFMSFYVPFLHWSPSGACNAWMNCLLLCNMFCHFKSELLFCTEEKDIKRTYVPFMSLSRANLVLGLLLHCYVSSLGMLHFAWCQFSPAICLIDKDIKRTYVPFMSFSKARLVLGLLLHCYISSLGNEHFA